MYIYKYLMVLAVLILSACSTIKSTSTSNFPDSANEQPGIVELLPKELHNYSYVGQHNYGGNLGYSLRYAKSSEYKHYADIYIWPAPKEASEYPHKIVVESVTEASLGDIYAAQEQGAYDNLALLEGLIYDTDGQILTMHKLSMLKGNLKSISYLFVTEYKGKLLKARVTLPDNEANRAREDVQEFVVELINTIIENIASA